MSLVSIITVNYNQPQVTIELLKSIKKFHQPEEIELIVVDNGSTENNEFLFKEVYPTLIFIRSDINLGFAGGNNLGIDVAKGEFLFLINNDTEITAELIKTLVNELNSNSLIGLISPLILYFEDKELVQYAGFTPLNYVTARNACIGQFDKNSGQYNHINEETGFIHGAAMMCRKKDLEKAGKMEENYFLYYEELDWCEKFKRLGKKMWFCGKTAIYHKESISVGKDSPVKTFFMTRNRMLFIRRNTNLINMTLFYFYYVLIACPKMSIAYLFNKKQHLVKWIWMGVFWNFTHKVSSTDLGFKLLKK